MYTLGAKKSLKLSVVKGKTGSSWKKKGRKKETLCLYTGQ